MSSQPERHWTGAQPYGTSPCTRRLAMLEQIDKRLASGTAWSNAGFGLMVGSLLAMAHLYVLALVLGFGAALVGQMRRQDAIRDLNRLEETWQPDGP